MTYAEVKQVLRDAWSVLYNFGSWVGSHSTKIAVAGRAGYLMAAGLGWTHLTLTQFALVGGFLEAVFAVFVETTTVSKQRMGERIDEKSSIMAAEKVSKIMSGGNGG